MLLLCFRYEERRKLKEDEELAKKVLAKKNDEGMKIQIT